MTFNSVIKIIVNQNHSLISPLIQNRLLDEFNRYQIPLKAIELNSSKRQLLLLY